MADYFLKASRDRNVIINIIYFYIRSLFLGLPGERDL
ncbi:MAG: hypothetical protein K0R50_449 [Eubacterium sp.]|jgi:hypothetical protein|nr:hypothetical protein [Eubacterium sp.]